MTEQSPQDPQHEQIGDLELPQDEAAAVKGGNVEHHEIVITKPVDKSTPRLS